MDDIDYKAKYEASLEKAKAYDEGLKTVKAILDSMTDSYLCTHLTKEDVREMYAKIYPELRESEDEKIRKWLYNLIADNLETTICPFPRKDVLAYLEQQKEQKPSENNVIIPQFHIGDYIKPKAYNEEHLIKDINKDGYVLDIDRTIPFKDEDVWEVAQQKPAWSEENEKIRKKIIGVIKEVDALTCNQSGEHLEWYKSAIAYLEKQKEPKLLNNEKYQTVPIETLDRLYASERELKEIKQKEQKPVKSIFPPGLGEARFNPISVVEQKPAEWSEDDEGNLKRAINICVNDFGEESETAKFLKSLPERFNLQPKQEWSEVDKQCLNEAIETLESLGYDGIANNLKSLRPQLQKLEDWTEGDDKMRKALLNCTEELRETCGWNYVYIGNDNIPLGDVENWLKSLRPSWKPTDEQYYALRDAIIKLDADDSDARLPWEGLPKLHSLLNDLSELRKR